MSSIAKDLNRIQIRLLFITAMKTLEGGRSALSGGIHQSVERLDGGPSVSRGLKMEAIPSKVANSNMTTDDNKP